MDNYIKYFQQEFLRTIIKSETINDLVQNINKFIRYIYVFSPQYNIDNLGIYAEFNSLTYEVIHDVIYKLPTLDALASYIFDFITFKFNNYKSEIDLKSIYYFNKLKEL